MKSGFLSSEFSLSAFSGLLSLLCILPSVQSPSLPSCLLAATALIVFGCISGQYMSCRAALKRDFLASFLLELEKEAEADDEEEDEKDFPE